MIVPRIHVKADRAMRGELLGLILLSSWRTLKLGVWCWPVRVVLEVSW